MYTYQQFAVVALRYDTGMRNTDRWRRACTANYHLSSAHQVSDFGRFQDGCSFSYVVVFLRFASENVHASCVYLVGYKILPIRRTILLLSFFNLPSDNELQIYQTKLPLIMRVPCRLAVSLFPHVFGPLKSNRWYLHTPTFRPRLEQQRRKLEQQRRRTPCPRPPQPTFGLCGPPQ